MIFLYFPFQQPLAGVMTYNHPVIPQRPLPVTPLRPPIPLQPTPATPLRPPQTTQNPITPLAPLPPTPVEALYALGTPSRPLLSTEQVIQQKNASNSRRNFAFRLSVILFTEEERLMSNCTGTKGKKALDPAKLELIRQLKHSMLSAHQAGHSYQLNRLSSKRMHQTLGGTLLLDLVSSFSLKRNV